MKVSKGKKIKSFYTLTEYETWKTKTKNKNGAGWKIKYLPYWNWFQDGWIEKDDAAAKDLCQFLRDFFAQ